MFLALPERMMRLCNALYGAPFTLRLIGRTMVLVHEPEAVRQVLSGQDSRLVMSDYNHVLEPIVESESVLLLDDERHGRYRKLLMEPFRRSQIQSHYAGMEARCAAHLARLRPGQRVSAFDLYEQITLEIILVLLLGPLDAEPLRSLRETLQPVTHVSLPLLTVPLLRRDLGPLSPGRRFSRGRARLSATLDGLIADRRAAVERGEVPPGLLTGWVGIRDEQGEAMSNLVLRSMIMTIIVTGHETTAAGLSWSLTHLLHSPEAAARLEEELRGASTLEQLDELPWLDAVCREALRIAPVLPAVPRTVREPVTISGCELPAGVEATPLAFYSHRNPRIFEEPERFNPERFIGRKYSPYEYYPFGGGPRMCLGWAFGLGQMKVLLATTLRRLRLERAEAKAPVGTWRQVTWIPKGGGLFQVGATRELKASK